MKNIMNDPRVIEAQARLAAHSNQVERKRESLESEKEKMREALEDLQSLIAELAAEVSA